MINVVIPMAGAGSRFVDAGYTKPKPFIDVAGKPMIERVLENLSLPNANYILLARGDHVEAEFELVADLKLRFNATLLCIDRLTEGTACTVLHARHLINNDIPLVIANSDQLVDFDPRAYLSDCMVRELDGSILTFIDEHRDPKWSFARLNDDGLVVEVKEKVPISDHATVGIYLFRRGSDFVDSAIDMIVQQDRVNNEYYTCPTYNYLIKAGKKVGIFDVAPETMHGLGTPEDLCAYLLEHND
jgi:UDP-N-acetylglucosamine diphosphorylase / glucose-1-phosphate thymidylyltransferase / UDP-N-acetylgalactosamine diphosphorylase / glucosamine-1-phosphate N-acetyltransferase / galactosamine-1-phosphate N-acetyltransferase